MSPSSERLVESLARNLQPVRPLPPPSCNTLVRNKPLEIIPGSDRMLWLCLIAGNCCQTRLQTVEGTVNGYRIETGIDGITPDALQKGRKILMGLIHHGFFSAFNSLRIVRSKWADGQQSTGNFLLS